MKTFKTLIATLLFTSLLLSCVKETKTGFTTITGTFEIPSNVAINLSKIENGTSTIIATSNLNAHKQFGFSVNPDKEGFYMIGTGASEMPLYIKGNQTFNLEFTPTEGYSLSNIPDRENEILHTWFKSNDTLQMFNFRQGAAKTFEEFFPFYEKYIPIMKEQHKNVNSDNKRFNELMQAYIDLNIEYEGFSFIFTPRVKHPTSEQMPSFYKDFIKGENYKSAIALDIPKGLRSLHQQHLYKLLHSEKGRNIKDKSQYKLELMKSIENDTLRGYYVLEDLKRYKTYDDAYLSFITPFRKDIALSEYASKTVEEYELTIKTMKPGANGYSFTYKDINGKDVSFSDFRGKYVYIDAWATWCAPCKKEIPYIKQLEKDLHGKDIVFVSISLDKPKDKEKWKAFVKEKELTGVQLITENAFDTKIARDYKINGIPRFLLFDKEGKIIDANAKRPSNPELKKQILGLLK